MATLFTFRNLSYSDFMALMKHYMQVGINADAIVRAVDLGEEVLNEITKLESEIVESPVPEHKVTVTFEEPKLMFIWSSKTQRAILLSGPLGDTAYMKSNNRPIINIR